MSVCCELFGQILLIGSVRGETTVKTMESKRQMNPNEIKTILSSRMFTGSSTEGQEGRRWAGVAVVMAHFVFHFEDMRGQERRYILAL